MNREVQEIQVCCKLSYTAESFCIIFYFINFIFDNILINFIIHSKIKYNKIEHWTFQDSIISNFIDRMRYNTKACSILVFLGLFHTLCEMVIEHSTRTARKANILVILWLPSQLEVWKGRIPIQSFWIIKGNKAFHSR